MHGLAIGVGVGRRRPDGALENEVLAVLWRSAEPVTPAAVNEALHGELAYTTVMTVLSRLWKKGLLERVPQGRAYAYRPVLSESELASRRLHDTLGGTTDRASVLAAFVGSLPKRDVRELRRLLDELGGGS